MKYLIALSLFVVGCSSVTPKEHPKIDRSLPPMYRVHQLLDQVTVSVITPGLSGTGSIVRTPSGETVILTNEHVCGEAAFVTLVGAKRLSAKVLKIDSTSDLCAIQIPQSYPIANSLLPGDEANTEEMIFSVGWGMSHYIFTFGPIMYLAPSEREFRGHKIQQAWAFSIPGQSGSPVVSSEGKLVGVTEGYVDTGYPEAYSMLIIPVSYVKEFLKDL